MNSRSQTLPSTSINQRTNSSVHVCWHRATTLAKKEFHLSLQTMLSGYLLRKFKNSNGWQKLWVVFTNSCLYFFKTFQVSFLPFYINRLLSMRSKSLCKKSFKAVSYSIQHTRPNYNTQ